MRSSFLRFQREKTRIRSGYLGAIFRYLYARWPYLWYHVGSLYPLCHRAGQRPTGRRHLRSWFHLCLLWSRVRDQCTLALYGRYKCYLHHGRWLLSFLSAPSFTFYWAVLPCGVCCYGVGQHVFRGFMGFAVVWFVSCYGLRILILG